MPQRQTYIAWTEEKIKIANTLFNKEAITKQISETTSVSQKSAQNFSKIFAYTEGFLHQKTGRKQTINEKDLEEAVTAILLDDCTLSIHQIRDKFPESLKAGKSKISSTLKKMKWSEKKVRQIPNERNSQRKIYASIVSIRPDSDLIFLDETGFNLHCSPNFGWSSMNITPHTEIPANRGQNISVLCAISVHGVIDYEIIDGTYNAKKFIEFLDTKLFPKMNMNSLVIMDNARIHHTAAVEEKFVETRANKQYLPPYSPLLNLIEEFFGVIKNKLRRIRPAASNRIFKEFLRMGRIKILVLFIEDQGHYISSATRVKNYCNEFVNVFLYSIRFNFTFFGR